MLFASAAAGVGVVERELGYATVNEALAAMNGRPAAGHVGLSIHEVIPDAAPAIEPVLRGVFETGAPLVDVPVAVEPPQGTRREFLASYYPVLDSTGTSSGWRRSCWST